MNLLVQWQLGSYHARIRSTSSVKDLICSIAEGLNLNSCDVHIFYDPKYQRPIPFRNTLASARLRDKQIIFMRYDGDLKDRKSGVGMKMTTESDSAKRFLGAGEQPTNDMKIVGKNFGPRAVSVAFFEHREKLKPSIDFQEESSCYAFRVSKEAIKHFQVMSLQDGFGKHRISFLFGRINKITGKVTAHCGVEPNQNNFDDHFEIDEIFDLEQVCTLASFFGMDLVGMAISHKPDGKFPMSEYMIRLAAKYQNMYGEYFTTLIVTPANENDVSVEAFQVSDVAMRLEKEGYFAESKDPHVVELKEELTVCQFKRKSVDVNLFLCAVRVRQTTSKIPLHDFPSPSQQPSLLDLKQYFADHESCPSWYEFFDFNLLVFLFTNDLISEDDLYKVVQKIKSKSEIDSTVFNQLTSLCNQI